MASVRCGSWSAVTSEEQIVILGRRGYRVETPWGRLPAGMSLGLVSQLAIDSTGRVYLLQRAFPSVLVFSAAGELEALWDHVRVFDGHGIYVSPDDRVFVIDRDAHEVLICDTSGKILQTLGRRNQPGSETPFNHPTDAVVAPDGEIYVSDGYGNSRVHRFAANGELKLSWGAPGAGPGQFTTPHAVWIDANDRVLIADRENNRVQVFDRSGAYLAEWRDLYHPMDICGCTDGSILVTDQVPRLSQFSLDGKLIGRCRPALNGAHGVWSDRHGNIFLAEMIPSRITKLSLLEDTS
jgi:DNA-binding beta-propeller fold protein YncE